MVSLCPSANLQELEKIYQQTEERPTVSGRQIRCSNTIEGCILSRTVSSHDIMFFLAIFTVLFAASPAYSLPLNCRDSQSATVSLLGGAALGAITGSGKAQRFTLPTAQAPVEQLRFANPQPIDLGKLITIAINKEYDASHLPAPCVQMEPGSLIGGWKNQSEDCLYATYYKPETAKAGDNLPIMVWVHGGSGIAGSSTAAGLDGSTLAVSQNVIVILVQYRLGAFGWLQTPSTFDEEGGIPGSDKVAGNQAVRDIVTALQQIRDIGASFGGDVNRVTLMGQSTGAQFVRTLLTTPSVQSLFSNAILVSDTQDYGPSTIDQNNLLGNLTMTSLGCDVDDIACARNKTADEIYNASSQAASDGPQVDEGIPIGTPWRPVIGTKYLPLGLEQNAAAGQGITKRIIMTTVQNEAGSMTAEAISASQPGATTLYMKNIQINITIEQALDAAFNQGRGSAAAALPQYQQTFNSSDSLRSTFEEIATDGLWRCAVQNNARK